MTVPSITLEVRMSSGARFSLELNDSLENSTVLSVKQLIGEKQQDCPPERQRLIYKGRIMDDARTLSDYGVVTGATLHLVKSSAPASSAPPSSTGTTAASTTRAPSTSTTTQPPPQANPPNPFASMQGMPGLPPGMPQPSPEQMQQMMQSPMMQSMLDNPDLMRSLMEANPQMRQMMDSNPQLREVFNNPELMRQSMEMMRNPDAMQHFQRQQDLAMSQLENIPGGFAALSSMYRNVQEPMMDAAAPPEAPTARNASSDGTSGANGTAMPNPWGSSTTTTTNSNTGGSTNASGTNNTNTPTNPWAAGAGAANPVANMMASMNNNPWGSMPLQPGQQPNPQQMEQTLQMLENPMVAQMMDQMLEQNPELMTQMMASNPQFQQLQQQNPMAAQMMRDPNFVRQMMNPQSLRAMMQLQQAFGGNMPPGGGMPNQSGSSSMPSAGQAGGAGMDFSQLLNQFQSTGLNNPSMGSMNPPTQQQAPADRFRVQLNSLRDMGFDDELANVRALEQHHGNLNRAVDDLINNMGSSSDNGAAPAETSTTSEAAAAPAPPPSEEETTPQEPPKGSDDKKND